MHQEIRRTILAETAPRIWKIMSGKIYESLIQQRAAILVGCQFCYGRGFIFTRHYERFEEPGPWMHYICQACEGKLGAESDDSFWYIKPDKIDEAIAWLKTATPPAKPFRIWRNETIDDPVEFFERLRHCDPRFWVDQILRLYELFGDMGDGEI